MLSEAEVKELMKEDDYELIEDSDLTKTNRVIMPYHPRSNQGETYLARHYQLELWDMFNFYTEEDFQAGFCEEEMIGKLKADEHGMFLKHKFKRQILSWHRRAGKDFDTWQRFLTYASLCKGIYYYFLPTATQAKKVIFDGQSNEGDKFIDFLPKELIAGHTKDWNKSEMKVELTNGSLIQILGSDNYNRVVGANPKGVVFSEYAICNPAAWSYIRPMLKMNGGFAWFISTPRGRNHFYKLIEMAKTEENKLDWTVSLKTIYDTGLLNKQDYLKEIASGMEKNKARQEYLIDFDAPIEGAYYSDQINRVQKEGRIGLFPIDTSLSVHCAFDIGMNDKTAIVFWQNTAEGFHIIGYYENDGKSFEHYIQELNKFMSKNQVFIENVYFPHDMKQREFMGGMKRITVARRALPNQRCHVLTKTDVAEGISMARRILPYCKFNTKLTTSGKNQVEHLTFALTSYHREFDDKKQTYKDSPVHDWASDPADAFRYMSAVCDIVLASMLNKKSQSSNITGMRQEGSLI